MNRRCTLAALVLVLAMMTGLIVPDGAAATDIWIIYPAGGEKLPAGSTSVIRWEGYEDHVMDVYLSVDAGKTYSMYVGSSSGGALSWVVPDIETDQARILVTGMIQYATGAPILVEGKSQGCFSIGRLPSAPVELSATVVSSSAVQLHWVDTADNETGFSIECNQEEAFTVGPDAETALHTGLSPDTRFSYRVRAFNDFGYSPYSNTVRVTTLPPVSLPQKTTIKLAIDSLEYLIDGVPDAMDTAPRVHRGRTMLPIRYVAQPLGAEVGWDATERKATVVLEHAFVELWIGQNRARVNGVDQLIDPADPEVMPLVVPPGRTMLPLRFVAEALGCQVQWNAGTREVTVEFDPREVEIPPGLVADCSDHVIDFDDLADGTRVFNQYGHMGVLFPFTPLVIEPAIIQTGSGDMALTPGEADEFAGKVVVEFTAPQSCVSMLVGLADATDGSKVMATLRAFGLDQAFIVPEQGMELAPAEEVAVHQTLIGPGPADVNRKLRVSTGDEALIHRVELSVTGGYVPVIDDLRFSTIGEPVPIGESYPRATIVTPADTLAISGFGPHAGALDLMGMVHEEVKLREVQYSVTNENDVLMGLLPFAGSAPDYTFGGPNIHGLLSPGENVIRVSARSFAWSPQTVGDRVTVFFDPLEPGVEAELLILTPDEFYGELVPLRDWKNSSGISTHIMSLSSIQADYRFSHSRDLPEQVKRAIAHAYLHHGTRYVMLVGDGDRFPVRFHRDGREGVSWGVVYPITDLYYACLFKPGGEFDDWDGNGDGIIAQWWSPPVDRGLADSFAQINIDNCSLKPDVAVGRVPASTATEVAAYVAKVIGYESAGFRSDDIVLWNADTDFRSDHVELDYVAAELLPQFTARKNYRPDGYEQLTGSAKAHAREQWRGQLIADLERGARFAIFFGHGTRTKMYPLTVSDLVIPWTAGRYPVYIASACDTGKFVQEWDQYLDVEGNYPPCWPNCGDKGWPDPNPEPAPIQPSEFNVDSMAEALLLSPGAGGVGFLGAHSGTNDASHPFVKLFIDAYNQEQGDRLGGMWMIAVREFVERYLETDHWFGRCSFMSHHIHKFVLFGDPSLRLRD